MPTRNLLITILALFAFHSAANAQSAHFRILLFSKTTLYRHDSITNGIQAIKQLGRDHGFDVEATEDASAFTRSSLERYKAVVFLSTSGDILNDAQQQALRDYLEQGGGLAGIHAAIAGPLATEEHWPWYGGLCRATFSNHSAIVPGIIRVENPNDPSTAHLPAAWKRVDEWYNFAVNPRAATEVLATLDESSYAGGTMDGDHPIVWRHQIGQGRFWYTALGHTKESFSEPAFQRHLLGGIMAAAGVTNAPVSK